MTDDDDVPSGLDRIVCDVVGHDWRSGQMYSDGWTDTCENCGKTRQVNR